MRVIESKMLNAMRNKRNFSLGNTKVDWWNGEVCRVYLHDNMICEYIPTKCSIYLQDCGWETTTTKSRLNAILSEFNIPMRIWQKDYVWYIGDDPWSGSRLFFTYH